MLSNKIVQILRQPAKIALILTVLALVSVMAIPSLRSSMTAKLNSGANLFLFDGDLDEQSAENSADSVPDTGQPKAKKPGAVKRVMTAPVRFFARLFKGKDDGNLAKKVTDGNLAKKMTENDKDKMKVIPVTRA